MIPWVLYSVDPITSWPCKWFLKKKKMNNIRVPISPHHFHRLITPQPRRRKRKKMQNIIYNVGLLMYGRTLQHKMENWQWGQGVSQNGYKKGHPTILWFMKKQVHMPWYIKKGQALWRLWSFFDDVPKKWYVVV